MITEILILAKINKGLSVIIMAPMVLRTLILLLHAVRDLVLCVVRDPLRHLSLVDL